MLKEWLLIASGAGLTLTSIHAKHFPAYSLRELEVLFILFALFVAVKGLQRSGFMLELSRRIEKGKAIPVKLVATTFFLSMLITNDVALVVMVPLTLALGINRKDILVILEALAANAGSALTPFGNPQNLFIYWFYGLHPANFVKVIAPFSIAFLIILVITSLAISTKSNYQNPLVIEKVEKSSYVYGRLR